MKQSVALIRTVAVALAVARGVLPTTIPVFVTANDSNRGQSSSVRVQVAEDEKIVADCY